ncbi:MAG: TonB-dependent receptor [Saprospiraceae bacterium]|nr:TonB-dependent receptor [Saprospiraceae bacterium]
MFQVQAQVTSSNMSGTVKDNNGEPLVGAIIEAKHLPSGTVYIAAAQNDGRYAISNMRVGGPYEITTSFVGFKSDPVQNVFLSLGEIYALNLSMVDASIDLGVVEIVAINDPNLTSQKTGASKNLSSRQLNTLPTISRSINDFTRLSPQAGNGGSFAGRDGRYNNITIDGANFNNNFGLSSSGLPGGDAQPISLDAIEEVQVNIAPYDVRQSNFTGAGINAVTRSGNNTLSGSVYAFYRDQSFNGRKVGEDTLQTAAKTTSTVFGARLGGPIIKDKLFFFINGEYENTTFPGIAFRPSTDGSTGTDISRTTVADMQRVSDFLGTTYNYNPGRISDYANNFNTKNYKALARLDWNISNSHKFTIRYNEVVSSNDQTVNATSAPNPRAASSRISLNSFAFENANYGFENSVRSITAELNSTLMGGKAANQILVTGTRIQDKRTSNSDIFPFVDIWEGGDAYMSLGYELFSFKNDVLNDVLTITENFTYFMGKHTITAGLNFDFMTFGNSFRRYGTSYYRFNSVDDFINGSLPTAFGLTYSLLPNGEEPYAELKFGLGGLYVQDEYFVNPNFKLTLGLRVDQPFFLEKTLVNPAVEALTFRDPDGNNEKIVMSWPNAKPLFSPRVGFNYDVKGDRSLQVRGGTGIFTGRLPWVWFTNLPTNSGMLQNTVEVTNAQTIADLGLNFNSNPAAHVSKFPQNAGESAPGSIAAIDQDFKMPQVWRTNLGFDVKLPFSTVLTLEGIYTKDLVAIYQRNSNQAAPIGNLSGSDTRPLFAATSAERRVNSGISEAMILDNTDQGSSYAFTIGLERPFVRGLSGSLAYTYMAAFDISGNPGSQAASAWTNNLAVRGQNDLDLTVSEFAVPHRVVGALTYSVEYLKNLATTFNLVYVGASPNRYSYRTTNDLNRDGNNADLIYIPANPSEIRFVDVVSSGNVLFTAQQQSDAFFAYIAQDDYLSANQGKYAERNGATLPFYHRFDFSIQQDLFANIGGRRNTLRISFDILNVGNMINSDWGIRKITNYNNGAILEVASIGADNQPNYRMARVSGALATETYRNLIASTSTWGAQVGLRYMF